MAPGQRDPDADVMSPEDLEAILEGVDDATRMLVIIDEPEAVPAETFRVLRGMFNKPNVYCLMIGSPTPVAGAARAGRQITGRREHSAGLLRLEDQPEEGAMNTWHLYENGDGTWHILEVSQSGGHVVAYKVTKDQIERALNIVRLLATDRALVNDIQEADEFIKELTGGDR